MYSRKSPARRQSPPPQPHPPPQSHPDWWSDRSSIFLLVLLYTAQGLPMGLAFGSIPLLLKESGATYESLAQFSLSSLPYTLKLLIAPIVDALYSPTFGRRKSWIVPVQLVTGFTLIFLSSHIPAWVQQANVYYLTPTFFLLLAMTATQDIAVDGWSLTMLQKRNVAYASTCQSFGLSLGFFATFTIFLAFNSPQFCDTYLRPFLGGKGAVTDLAGTLCIAGAFYVALTVFITLFKKEVLEDDDLKKSRSRDWSQSVSSITATYSDLFVVTKLPAVRKLVAALLVAKVGFASYDNVTDLKLLEFGFAKETMASMAVFQTPFILLGTLLMGKWTAKVPPLRLYLAGFLTRFIISLTGPLTVTILTWLDGKVTTSFYFFVLSMRVLYSLASECLMFIGMGAFFLNITSSSVHVAGSYLTLLNTSSNMGGIWPKAITLWLVSKLTIREHCTLPDDVKAACPILYDGYYIMSFALIPLSCAIGLHLYRTIPRLQQLPDAAWKVSNRA